MLIRNKGYPKNKTNKNKDSFIISVIPRKKNANPKFNSTVDYVAKCHETRTTNNSGLNFWGYSLFYYFPPISSEVKQRVNR